MPAMSALAPAVFLDRDGTLIEEAGYLDDLDRIALFPSTVDALRVLARGGYRLVVITNQSGIALGLFDEPFVRRTHDALQARLASCTSPQRSPIIQERDRSMPRSSAARWTRAGAGLRHSQTWVRSATWPAGWCGQK